MQIKRLQSMKESTPGLNDDMGIAIASAENFVGNKYKKKEKIGRRDLTIINKEMHID